MVVALQIPLVPSLVCILQQIILHFESQQLLGLFLFLQNRICGFKVMYLYMIVLWSFAVNTNIRYLLYSLYQCISVTHSKVHIKLHENKKTDTLCSAQQFFFPKQIKIFHVIFLLENWFITFIGRTRCNIHLKICRSCCCIFAYILKRFRFSILSLEFQVFFC